MSAIVGIDLGTTFSAISYLNPMGRPEIVPNRDGERIMPSALFFPEHEGQKVITGVEAINSRYQNPARCVRWIKEKMGDPDYLFCVDEYKLTPSAISAAILKKLKDDAEMALGQDASDVVITVPANFAEAARKATMDAGEIAGFNVLGLVNEPTAAAFYYAVTHDIEGKVMVFDLGGGTFDVTVVNIVARDVQVVCSCGDRHLGGKNFDEALFTYFETFYKEQTDAPLCEDEGSRAEMEDYCESIKKTLSRRPVAPVRLMGSAGQVRTEISEAKMNELISPYLSKIEMLIESVVADSGLDFSDIKNVILVGGSSRLPVVTSIIQRMFGYDPLMVGNLDEAVSLGAALYAGFRKMEDAPEDLPEGVISGLRDLKLRDVCNHSYGTTAFMRDELTGKPELRNVILIKKNTPIPCEVRQVFLTAARGQTEVVADVTQGEGTDLSMVEHLASEKLELPPGREAGKRIEITYRYDVNQRMSCVFRDEESGVTKVIDLDTSSGGKGLDFDLEATQSALSSMILE
jgi:molecular chaperone DnaK